jgi:CubicO group peptidase (beta-lactamase class C family)
MNKLLILLVACMFTQMSYSQDKTQKIDEVVSRYASLNKFNGAVLVAEKGNILLEKGYGYRNLAAHLPNDPQTIFQLGSITKEFTAAVVLKLAKQKKLALTDPLSKYYPDFPKGDSITLQNLLTHTSGIFNYSDTKEVWEQSQQETDEGKVLAFIKSKPLSFRPGEKYSYSNSNYMLLAYIIQKVTGKTYEAVVSGMILNPLHMTRSGFDFTALKDKDKATGYWNFSAAKYMEGPPTNPTQFIGSGEMHSTVIDLYKWHQALQDGKILDQSLQQQAYRPFKKEYGYGWEIMDSIGGKKVIGHSGRMLGGFETTMVRVPEDNVIVILLNNNADGPYLKTISRDILSLLYGKPYTLPEPPLVLPAEKLKAYTGKYGQKDRFFEVQLIGGHLFGKEGDNLMELIPVKNNYFRFMEHDGEEGTFEFGTDANGVPTDMTFNGGNGKKMTIKKFN